MTRDDVYELLTVKEYACMYRVHIKTVYNAIRCNRLPHEVERIGGAIRIAVPREGIQEGKSA
jgi:hypothetical protein